MTIGIDPSESLFERPVYEREVNRDVHAVRDTLPSQAYNTVNLTPFAARVEIDDVAYHEGSALTLPLMPTLGRIDRKPWSFLDRAWASAMESSAPEHWRVLQEPGEDEDDADELPDLGRSTLVLAAIVLGIAKLQPTLRLLVTGHADSAETSDADALSAARAQNFLAIVTGDRDLFVSTTKQFSAPSDLQTIGTFLATTFGWPWTDAADTDAAVAADLLRTSYNAAARQESIASFFTAELSMDEKKLTDADLGALYDCYNIALAALLGVKTAEELSKMRELVQFADADSHSFGYGAGVARDSRFAWRSRMARRVEAVFVEERNLRSLAKRGVARVYDRDLFTFVDFTPNWIRERVAVASDDETSLGEPVEDGSMTVDVKIPKKPGGLDYFDDLIERPPAWPGEDEDEPWQESE